MKQIEKFSNIYYISTMNRPLSNELWDQMCPDKFTLLHNLTKTAVEQVEKDERYDWEMDPFLREMEKSLMEKQKKNQQQKNDRF